ncbi:MAG: transposase [Pseudomonadota bacterium]
MKSRFVRRVPRPVFRRSALIRAGRAFATSLRRLAKIDRVDASMIREMARRLDLPGCPPETEEVSQLKALQPRRRQRVEDARREKICLG